MVGKWLVRLNVTGCENALYSSSPYKRLSHRLATE